MLFGVWCERRDGRGPGLRGRVLVTCSCGDKDDGEGARINVVVCEDLGTANAGEGMSWGFTR